MIALPFMFSGIVSGAGSFVRNNWRWLVPVLMVLCLWWFIAHIQNERDAAIKSLAEYQQAVKAAADRRKAENFVKEEKSKLALGKIATDHKTETDLLRKRYENLHQNDQAAADRVAANWRDSLRLSVAAANGLPDIPQAAGKPAQGARNCDATANQYETIRIACEVTTVDYNALWESWNQACQVYGCK